MDESSKLFDWYLFFYANFFRIFEEFKVVLKYYSNIHFLLIDLLLKLQYLFANPHRVCKKFYQNKPKKYSNLYGETPLTTLDKIATKFQISSKDIVYELGCGIGRTAYWLRAFVKCQVYGIEQTTPFIQRAQKVKDWMKIDKVHFLEENFFYLPMQKATVLYLYGTLLNDEEIALLIENFSHLKLGTKIITVSFALSDYDASLFRTSTQFQAHYPWGKADVYLNIRI